jgi:predicted nucleic acid-binding protein
MVEQYGQHAGDTAWAGSYGTSTRLSEFGRATTSAATIDSLCIVLAEHSRLQPALNDFAAFRLSHGVGLLDALIGHTAIGRNEVLATFNVKHFGPIPGLQTIQPY